MSDALTRAKAWMADNEADLCSGAWSGLAESLAHLLASERGRALTEAAASVPSNWCDELLTGKPGTKIPATCPDIERLLQGVSARIRSLKSPAVEG